tara:strand:- start:122 stop:1114 length:993 start_codon:yes stop_codon:yes gene_type:complete
MAIKIGNKIVQKDGGGYRPQGYNKSSNNSIKKVNSGNARDDYRANQGYRAQQKRAFEQQQAEMNRGSIQRMANKGVINRSDFKDGAARLKGESPQDYAKFMQGLHKSNPAAMQKAFPFSSGAMVGKLANLIPGMGALKGIAGLLNKGKNKAQSVGSGIKNTFLDEFSGTVNGIKDLFNGNTTTDPVSQGIRTLPESVFEQQNIPYPQQKNMNMNLPVEDLEAFSRIFNFPGNQNYGGREIFATNQLPGLETFSEEDIMNMPYDSFYKTEGDLITRMNDGTVNRANGGYMSSFPNQNLNTESLSASDNIDDRIMKNLQFENQSRGTYGTGF